MIAILTRTQRATRDIWLSWAAGILAGSAAVLVVADIFGIVATFQNQEVWGFQINAICKLIFDAALIPAFGLSSVAFLSQAITRAKMLRTGATVAATGATIGLIGRVAAISASMAHQYPTSYVVVLSIGAVASVCFIFAALLASNAFAVRGRTTDDGVLSQRDRQLGRACVGLAGSFAFVTLSQFLLVRYLSGVGVGNTVTTGISVSAVGTGIAAGAGLISAFCVYRRLQGPLADEDWLLARDRLLGVAVGAFAAAFLVMGLGMFAQATSGEAGDKFAGTAFWWISGVASIGNMVASMCATLGFLSCSWDVTKLGFLSRD